MVFAGGFGFLLALPACVGAGAARGASATATADAGAVALPSFGLAVLVGASDLAGTDLAGAVRAGVPLRGLRFAGLDFIAFIATAFAGGDLADTAFAEDAFDVLAAIFVGACADFAGAFEAPFAADTTFDAALAEGFAADFFADVDNVLLVTVGVLFEGVCLAGALLCAAFL